MRKIIKISLLTILSFTISVSTALACDVCEKNQPEMLKNITHGPGPQSDWDYAIIIIGVVIVSLTLFFSLKFLIKPREKDPEHIKNIVVNEGKLVN